MNEIVVRFSFANTTKKYHTFEAPLMSPIGFKLYVDITSLPEAPKAIEVRVTEAK